MTDKPKDPLYARMLDDEIPVRDAANVLIQRNGRASDAAELTSEQLGHAFKECFGFAKWQMSFGNQAFKFARSVIAADRALRQPALPEGWKQTAYGPAQSLKSLMAEEAARVDMPVVAWQVRWTAAKKESPDINPWTLTSIKYRSNPLRDEFALVRQADALAALAQKDAEIAALTKDRDEWKEATLSANERFKIAERRLAATPPKE